MTGVHVHFKVTLGDAKMILIHFFAWKAYRVLLFCTTLELKFESTNDFGGLEILIKKKMRYDMFFFTTWYLCMIYFQCMGCTLCFYFLNFLNYFFIIEYL